jgi:hypothetical protein
MHCLAPEIYDTERIGIGENLQHRMSTYLTVYVKRSIFPEQVYAYTTDCSYLPLEKRYVPGS